MSRFIDPVNQGYKVEARDTRHPDETAASVLDNLKKQECQPIVKLTEEERQAYAEAIAKSTSETVPFEFGEAQFAMMPRLTVYKENKETGENEIVTIYDSEDHLREYFRNKREEEIKAASLKFKRVAEKQRE